MPRRRDQIESLLGEAEQIEGRLAEWQSSPVAPDASETRNGARAYTSWFARALRFVPEGERDTFTDMYQGGAFIKRIRGFLSAPLEESLLWDEATPNPLVDRFQHPFKTDFEAPQV
jgi:hypothetical protein